MLKLGSVPFLNVRPLIWPLEEGLVEHGFEVIYAPPSDLSRKLLEREIDLGLIPVAELLNRAGYTLVPGISISSFGKVDSVVLVTKSRLDEMRNVAVDVRSQSSTALLRVVLEIFRKLSPNYVKREPGENFLTGVDGGMLIGNSGLKINYSPPPGYNVFDLGEIWTAETGLPFVYAVFAVNPGISLGENLQAMHRAKSEGIQRAWEIARLESQKIGLSEEICKRYITERIRYDLGEDEIRGILAFSEFLVELGEIEETPEFEMCRS